MEGRRAARSTASPMNEWDRGRPSDPSLVIVVPNSTPRSQSATSRRVRSVNRGRSVWTTGGFLRIEEADFGWSLLNSRPIALVRLASSARRGMIYFATRRVACDSFL